MGLDEGKLRQRAEDGIKAKAVIENEVFRAVAEDYQKDLLKAFKGTDDIEVALEARRKVLVFEEILARLLTIAQQGDHAQGELAQMVARQEQDYRERATV